MENGSYTTDIHVNNNVNMKEDVKPKKNSNRIKISCDVTQNQIMVLFMLM